MIIASDLDRTLIYSYRAMEQFGQPFETNLKPVERKDGKWISFMTETSMNMLKEICRKSLFVPVTTRTVEQFKRVAVFQQALPVPYVIAANGAEILLNGERIHGWTEHIAARLKLETAPMEEVVSHFQKKVGDARAVLKRVENLFFYLIFDHPPDGLDKETLVEIAARFGWQVSLQGRKLYFIPKPINKGDALSFICDREGSQPAAGAGDSILDRDFLERCVHRFIPRHGELAEVGSVDRAVLTKNWGIKAGEEILEQFLSLLTVKN